MDAERGIVMTRKAKLGCLFSALVAMVAIAVPNFMSDPDRVKVSRARSDMRLLATAIEAYSVEQKSYPAWTLDPALKTSWKSESEMPTFYRRMASGPETLTLTTPLVFTTGIPMEPFTGRDEERTFAYWVRPDGKGWILVSAGPDKVFNLDLATIQSLCVPFREDARDRLRAGAGPRGAYTYDPTNGAVSTGDLWRVPEGWQW